MFVLFAVLQFFLLPHKFMRNRVMLMELLYTFIVGTGDQQCVFQKKLVESNHNNNIGYLYKFIHILTPWKIYLYSY